MMIHKPNLDRDDATWDTILDEGDWDGTSLTASVRVMLGML